MESTGLRCPALVRTYMTYISAQMRLSLQHHHAHTTAGLLNIHTRTHESAGVQHRQTHNTKVGLQCPTQSER